MKCHNIFEEFYAVRETVIKNQDIYASDEYLKLLNAIEAFFKSKRWSHSDEEYRIYLYSGKGYATAKVAEILGMNANTYRSKVSRISVRIRGMLFNGSDMAEVCFDSEDAVRQSRLRIEHMNLSFDFYSESIVWDMVAPVIDTVSDEDVVSEEELFTALAFLTVYSKSAVKKKLALINPKALAVAVRRLTGADYDEVMAYYQNMLKRVSVPAMSEKQIAVYKQG